MFFFAWNQSIKLFVNFVKLKVFRIDLNTSISRCIIHDNYLIICIVLHKNWIQGLLSSESLIIHPAGHCYAKRQLGFYLWKVEFLVKSEPLFLILWNRPFLRLLIQNIIEFSQMYLGNMEICFDVSRLVILKLNSLLDNFLVSVEVILNPE